MASKLFEILLVLKSGRECLFTVEESVCEEFTKAFHEDPEGRIRTFDYSGAVICVSFKETALCFARVAHQTDPNKGMN